MTMDRFFIDEPCKENIAAMPQARGGRHCATCDHIVLDARNMTRQAFLRYVEDAGGKVCAQIQADDLGEAVFRSPPPPPKAPRRHFAGGLVLLSALTSGGCGIGTPNVATEEITPVVQVPPVAVPTSETVAEPEAPARRTPRTRSSIEEIGQGHPPPMQHIAGGIRHVPPPPDDSQEPRRPRRTMRADPQGR